MTVTEWTTSIGFFGYFMLEFHLLMNKMEARTFGSMVRERRESLGLTIRQVAASAAVPHTTIMRIERGDFATPRPDRLARLATALGFTPEELFASVGYLRSTDLPDISTYLKTKYPNLPETAITELRQRFDQLAGRRPASVEGVNGAGSTEQES